MTFLCLAAPARPRQQPRYAPARSGPLAQLLLPLPARAVRQRPAARRIPGRVPGSGSVCPARPAAAPLWRVPQNLGALSTGADPGPPLQWGYIKVSAALRGCSAAVQLDGRGGHELRSTCQQRDPPPDRGAHSYRGAVLGPLPGHGRHPRRARARPAGQADGSRRGGCCAGGKAAARWQARRAAEVLAQLGSSRRGAFAALSWEWVLRANGQVAYRLATVDGRAERNPWTPVTQLAAAELPWLRQDRARAAALLADLARQHGHEADRQH